MDMTTLRVAPTAALHLRGLDNQPLYSPGADGKPDPDKPVRIHFYAPGSPQQTMAEDRATRRALRRMEASDGRPTAPAPDDRRNETAEDLAAMTHHFENLTYPPAGDAEGNPLFRAFYADPALGFLTAQAAKFAPDWANYSA